MGGDMGGGGGMRPEKETKADMIASRLKLSGDQKSEFVTMLESTQKEAAPVIQQVLKCREDLANAMLAGKSDADVAPLNQALSEGAVSDDGS